MRGQFVQTANARAFLEGVTALKLRGADEACLMVVDGQPGLGKSQTLSWWATQTGSPFLRAKDQWTPNWMLRELLQSLNVSYERSFERNYGHALRALGERLMHAQAQDMELGVVIDEADHVVSKGALLETLRDLSDTLEIPFILVGMGQIRSKLKRFPQVSSRVAQYVQFNPSGADDVRALVNAYSAVEIAPDLIDRVVELSGGRFREVKEAIAAINRFGARNKGTVTIDAMRGQTLMNQRETGKPIKVL
ncbi:ATP-binding protein [Martelella sp. UBA3392]|uniref:ATP-binding protein n=1 Tax=Martelella sp. UBA3392 TaxID=1946834 RepID=UPI0031F480DE